MNKWVFRVLIVSLGCLPAAPPARAQTITLDFDTGTPVLTRGQSIPFDQTAGGLTARFSSPSGSAFSIQSDASTGFRLSQFSNNYLYQNNINKNSLDIKFSGPVTAITLTFATADFQQVEVPTTLQLTAYNDSAQTPAVGSATAHGRYGSDTMPMGQLSFSSGQPFNLVEIAIPYQPLGASAFLVDNITVTPASSGPASLRFVPVTPCRVVDTRLAAGPFGGPGLSGTSRDFAIPSGGCGIPASAAAYSLNVTVVPQGSLSYLTIWPAGQAQPYVSTLNSVDGRVKANAAIVPAGAGGGISVYAAGATDVVIDINGYFVSASDPAGLAFYALPPCRVVDTRLAPGPFGAPSMAAGQTRAFPIPGGSCGVPASAKAYSLNFTVVPSGPLWYLTTWPAGGAQPVVSTLNAFTGSVTANAAIVPAGPGGAINVFTSGGTDVVIDINGYFAPPGGANALSYYATAPCRVMDTRNANGPLGGPALIGQRDVPASTSACGLPASASAYVLNATVVAPGALAYLTLWPSGNPMPVVSTLNAFEGGIVANAAIVPANNGSISAYATSLTDLVLDASGYFAP